MIDRRRFLKTLVVAASTPTAVMSREDGGSGFGPLKPDPGEILDLPAGFDYTVISTAGEEMDDRLLVPGRHDGMAAFPAENGTVRLVCNHELRPSWWPLSGFGPGLERLEHVNRGKLYDAGGGTTPGIGGTTTIHYDPARKERLGIHMSLAGTEINCAGGAMPWGSWLSCEETFANPGQSFERGRIIQRERRHGYVFEVPAAAEGLADPVPLTAMGRFEHEAAAVDPATGIIYMTEDRHRSLLYRFLPAAPGRLREGGRLQALAVRERPRFDSRNWGDRKIDAGQWLETDWIDLENPDSEENDLRLRGHEKGAALFARGEGICRGDGQFAFTCTIGGPERLGQIFLYAPSPAEGTPDEVRKPGRLGLLCESAADALLRNADNLTMSPWGDLVVCEDTVGHCGLVGVRPDGSQYPIADNPYNRAELTGICFSPDQNVMFVNVQQVGVTLAITGPWSTAA
jgi:secreted PhoX family phosphatase